MAEIIINKNNFNSEVINSQIPVVLDFWATWCGPCQMLSPELKKLAEAYEGKIKVGKVNVDDEPQLAQLFGIESIPTVIIFKNGQPLDVSVGYKSFSQLEQWLSKNGI